jgi:hypothetical protein
MSQVTGIAYIHTDGDLHRSKEDGVLNTGGKTRTPIVGHKVYGYAEKVTPATLEVTLAHTADTDVDKLNKLTDATITFECDTGTRYTITSAFTTEPCVLSAGEGDLTLKMAGDPAVEL